MSGEGQPSDRMWCYARGRELRERGFSWPQVVAVLALDCTATPLRLYRLAHGRSAADVVDEFNQRDPAGTATLRVQRLYDYETWPEGGRRPTVAALPVLAEIYKTAARDLIVDATYLSYPAKSRDVIDAADFCHLDRNRPRRLTAVGGLREHSELAVVSGTSLGGGAGGWELHSWQPGPGESARGADDPRAVLAPEDSLELFRAVTRLEPDPRQREVLFQLALLVGGVSGLPVLRELTPDERERLARVARSPQQVDPSTVRIFEKITIRCRRLDDHRGPGGLHRAVSGCRSLIRHMLSDTTRTPLRPRLLRVYGELSQLLGWFRYDLMDYDAADHYLREGLVAAQEAKDLRMTTFIHCCLSHMANDRKQVPTALDHAFAARGWAVRSGSVRLGTYAELLMAWAFAEDEQSRATDQALKRADNLFPDRPTDNDPEFAQFVDRGFTVGMHAGCWVILQRPEQALPIAQEAFAHTLSSHPRDGGFRLVEQARALVQQKQIDEAAHVGKQIAEIAASHGSVRLTRWLRDTRQQMQPWAGTAHVRDLDEQLAELGLASRAG